MSTKHILLSAAVLLSAACGKNIVKIESGEGYTIARQSKGPTLGYTSAPILEIDGLLFKDLNRDGTLNPYEDWRLESKKRAEDLAKRMDVGQI